MADTIRHRYHQYVGHWPDWPSSAPATHGRQHYYTAGLVRPVPDNYALQTTDKQDSTIM